MGNRRDGMVFARLYIVVRGEMGVFLYRNACGGMAHGGLQEVNGAASYVGREPVKNQRAGVEITRENGEGNERK